MNNLYNFNSGIEIFNLYESSVPNFLLNQDEIAHKLITPAPPAKKTDYNSKKPKIFQEQEKEEKLQSSNERKKKLHRRTPDEKEETRLMTLFVRWPQSSSTSDAMEMRLLDIIPAEPPAASPSNRKSGFHLLTDCNLSQKSE